MSTHSHWIDGGAGYAFAQKDYLGSRDGGKILRNRPRMTAVSFQYPSFLPKVFRTPRFRVLTGRYFESLSLAKIQKADLITDVAGIIHYTRYLTTVLNKYMSLLNQKGRLYVFSPAQATTIINKLGRPMSLFEWLSGHKDLAVEYVQGDKRSIRLKDAVFSVQKMADEVKLPKLNLISAEKVDLPLVPIVALKRCFQER
jgi:hypothetical protein